MSNPRFNASDFYGKQKKIDEQRAKSGACPDCGEVHETLEEVLGLDKDKHWEGMNETQKEFHKTMAKIGTGLVKMGPITEDKLKALLFGHLDITSEQWETEFKVFMLNFDVIDIINGVVFATEATRQATQFAELAHALGPFVKMLKEQREEYPDMDKADDGEDWKNN